MVNVFAYLDGVFAPATRRQPQCCFSGNGNGYGYGRVNGAGYGVAAEVGWGMWDVGNGFGSGYENHSVDDEWPGSGTGYGFGGDWQGGGDAPCW